MPLFAPRIAFLIAATSLSALSHAQTAPAGTSIPAEAPLKGPSITERSPKARPAGSAGFGADSIEKKKAAAKKPGPPLTMAQLMSALDVLRQSSFPLTAEQSAKAQSVASEFEADTKAYMQKHQAEIDALRAKLSPTDRSLLDQQLSRGGPLKASKIGFGGKKRVTKQKSKDNASNPQPSGSSTPSTPTTPTTPNAAAETRASLIQIYAGKPKTQDAEARLLGILTGDQRPLVEARLNQLSQSDTGRANPKRTRPGAKSLK